jgi:hypothetical protein
LQSAVSKRSNISTINDWIMAFGGHQYPLGLPQTIRGDSEPPPTTFEAYAIQLFGANPVVWAAESIRKAVFSQAEFVWRDVDSGETTGGSSLELLRRPWPGGSTSRLLTKALLHADLGGNGYVLRVPQGPPRLQLMRPDRVTIILGSQLEPDDPSLAEDAELAGYMYMPPGSKPRFYFPDQVGHIAFMPDPLATFRGMSWLTPVVREVQGDKIMTEHKLKFFEQGATPNLIITFDATQTLKQVTAFKELAEDSNTGLENAYRTLYLGGGADGTVVGSDLQKLDYSKTQGKAETRILMAAGVHPVIAGASEGMQGASLNAGNFGQVRRLFSDIRLQDMWNEASVALENLLSPPAGARLAVQTRDIPFLQDDAKDEAEIQREQSRAISQYVREGFTPASAVAAIDTNDVTKLEFDDRFISVQLQKVNQTGDDGDGSDEGGASDGDDS